MENKEENSQKMDLLSAVEQVVDLSKGSHLDDDFFRRAARPIKYLEEKLDLTKEQCVLMSLFVDHSNANSISIRDFARHLDCSTTKLIRLTTDIDVLEKRGFICCCHERNDRSYKVPREVIEAFKRDEKYVPCNNKGLDCAEFFGVLQGILEMRFTEEISSTSATQRIIQTPSPKYSISVRTSSVVYGDSVNT